MLDEYLKYIEKLNEKTGDLEERMMVLEAMVEDLRESLDLLIENNKMNTDTN